MELSLEQKIENLTWHNLVNKLKDILRRLRVLATPKYQVFTAVVSCTVEEGESIIVLENTIGDITFARTSTGQFIFTSNGLFTEDKTWHVEGNVDFLTDVAVYINSSSEIGLEYKVYSEEDTDFILSDAMTQQTVEIRVYL